MPLMVNPRPLSPPNLPAGFSFPAARRRCPRRSSATCATRCLPRSSSPATASAPRTRSRRATASAGSWRATRCARLQALGIAEIRMGKGGGARVARGNPRLFAEALAVQLDLTGVTAAEIMDAQRAIECLAAELAAENATDDDIARLRQLDRRRRSQHGRRRALHASSAPNSISPSPRPRTTACWWCSSSRCSTCPGRAAIRR